MNISFGFSDILKWVSTMFPHMETTLAKVLPASFILLSILGVVVKLLPEPSRPYKVPSKEDLDVFLKGKGYVAYIFAKVSRKFAIGINMVIFSRAYYWIYTVSVWVFNVIARIRGKSPKSGTLTITRLQRPKFDVDKVLRKRDKDK